MIFSLIQVWMARLFSCWIFCCWFANVSLDFLFSWLFYSTLSLHRRFTRISVFYSISSPNSTNKNANFCRFSRPFNTFEYFQVLVITVNAIFGNNMYYVLTVSNTKHNWTKSNTITNTGVLTTWILLSHSQWWTFEPHSHWNSYLPEMSHTNACDLRNPFPDQTS